MNYLKDIWSKLKQIKHIQIILPIVVGGAICLIYFCFLQSPKNDSSDKISTDENASTMEYVDNLENKLCNVLSNISGVGDCEVVITLASGFEYQYATDTETKTTISGGAETTITTETVILVSNEPVVVKEIYPVVKGVVVVTKGAEDFGIKMNILSAVETVLEIDRNCITILS